MRLTSSAFKEGEAIPRRFTCQGDDINPELFISEVPSRTKSLALIVDDPDVPENIRKDRLWVHWVLYNIDPKTTQIKENSQVGLCGKNTDGKNSYMGPCPPDRKHRYFFKLYALDIRLDVGEGATKDQIEALMQGHILEKVSLMGVYEKSPLTMRNK